VNKSLNSWASPDFGTPRNELNVQLRLLNFFGLNARSKLEHVQSIGFWPELQEIHYDHINRGFNRLSITIKTNHACIRSYMNMPSTGLYYIY
jgi:hypothetical protein